MAINEGHDTHEERMQGNIGKGLQKLSSPEDNSKGFAKWSFTKLQNFGKEFVRESYNPPRFPKFEPKVHTKN
ncbi:hypothetical protein Plhal304r1_c006g0025011 [Plasmopara halstedii]